MSNVSLFAAARGTPLILIWLLCFRRLPFPHTGEDTLSLLLVLLAAIFYVFPPEPHPERPHSMYLDDVAFLYQGNRSAYGSLR